MRLYHVTWPKVAARVADSGFDETMRQTRLGAVRNNGVWLMSFPYIFDLERFVCIAADFELAEEKIEEWHWHDQGTAYEIYLAPEKELNANSKFYVLTPLEAALVINKYWYKQELPQTDLQA